MLVTPNSLPSPSPSHNRILAAAASRGVCLSARNIRTVFLSYGKLEAAPLPFSSGLIFPLTAVLVRRQTLNGASGQQLALIGRDGGQELGTPWDSLTLPGIPFVIQPGTALVVGSDDVYQHRETLLPLLQRYKTYLVLMLASTLECASRHNATQRVALWILSIARRSPLKEIRVSHEELASLIGFRREAITVALGELRRLGAISCFRSRIEVLDFCRLLDASCDCHRTDALGVDISTEVTSRSA
jgi:hypothetical protein